MPSHSTDLTPRPLNSPLAWTDFIYSLQEALEDFDPAAQIYIVGGAVRDAYLRRPVKDIDITTDGGGRKLARWIAGRFGGAFFPLDHERDVGRAIVSVGDEQTVLDVAALRGDLGEDLRDRDFTINAMAVDLRADLNLVIDPTDGARDLRDKVLRRCSPDSIASDPVRVLRAIRQSAQLGCRIDRETLVDMRANMHRMTETSVERSRDQWFKIFALPRPTQALRVADSLGVLTVSLPELLPVREETRFSPHFEVVDRIVDLIVTISPRRSDETAAQFSLGIFVMAMDRYRARLQQHLTRSYGEGRSHASLLVFAALLHTLPVSTVGSLCERMHLSNAESVLVQHAASGWPVVMDSAADPLSIYRFWKRFGESGLDVVLLSLAHTLGAQSIHLKQDQWLVEVERCRLLLSAWYDEPERLVNPPVLLNGNDLMTILQIPAGPLIGMVLERIREGQVMGEIGSREDAIQRATELVRSAGTDGVQ